MKRARHVAFGHAAAAAKLLHVVADNQPVTDALMQTAPVMKDTIAVRSDGFNSLPAIYIRTPDGQEFEHPVSCKKAVRMAYELLQIAAKSMGETGLLLAINALRPIVFLKG